VKRGKARHLFGSARHAKLERLKAKGLLPTKAELDTLAATAVAAGHHVTKLPPSQLLTSPPTASVAHAKHATSGR
jgi:hypothetical protein